MRAINAAELQQKAALARELFYVAKHENEALRKNNSWQAQRIVELEHALQRRDQRIAELSSKVAEVA